MPPRPNKRSCTINPSKTLVDMLNDLLEVKDAVVADNTFFVIQKTYRRVLLRIHPDKTPHDDWRLQLRSTELVKVVNSTFDVYKAQVEVLS